MSNTNEDFIKMFDLGTFSEDNFKISKNNKIEYRKKMSKIFNKSRKDAKKEECFYCGKECSSFCNSHSIPAFLLRNIAIKGEVYNSNKLVKIALIDDEDGVNQSGTFQLICRECDSKIFRDYENPNNYENEPTTEMIAQIAMKNYLKNISKRRFEIALYDNMKSDLSLPSSLHKQRQLVNNLDLQEYYEGFKKAKKVNDKGWGTDYYLFYYEELDYVVPIAFQNNLTILVDFEGNIINDLYNMSPEYKTKDIHACIFPFESSSIIMMFVDSKFKRYRKFYRQFKKLTHNNKLAAINYMIFNYSEELYINKNVKKKVLNDKSLIEAGRKTIDIVSSKPINDPKSIAGQNFDFSLMHDISNLLLEEYKIR